jgi:hypothetical protein
LLRHRADDHIWEAKIHLGLAGRVRQRQEQFLPTNLLFPDLILDNRVPAREAVLGMQTLPDAARGVPLLPRCALVGFENGMNDRQEGSMVCRRGGRVHR